MCKNLTFCRKNSYSFLNLGRPKLYFPKTYKITSSPTNEVAVAGSTTISSAETNYISDGTLELYETTITNTTTVTNTRLTTTHITRVTTNFEQTQFPQQDRGGGKDPLAQTFTVDQDGGFLTEVDLYFYKNDQHYIQYH